MNITHEINHNILNLKDIDKNRDIIVGIKETFELFLLVLKDEISLVRYE